MSLIVISGKIGDDGRFSLKESDHDSIFIGMDAKTIYGTASHGRTTHRA
jgi:hypothetical protein